MNSIISPAGVKITSWGMIFIQVITPLLFSINVSANTKQLNNIEDTIIGLESVIENNGTLYSAPIPHAAPSQNAVLSPRAATPFFRLPDAVSETSRELPSLGSDNVPDQQEHHSLSALASGTMQAGRILSDKNTADASVNYIKSVGEGLINQQINDWLNQKGTARVSIDSEAKITGDLLYPLAENAESLFFTQAGIRAAKDDRKTINLGLGYRQYLGDWMYGVNTFYDYEYSGKNARLGVGTELWGDYLRLSANGYFGLTDWHQSKLSDMRDYDERPASGFDIRANAWLPAYPQLGGSLKYEHYFGKGIDLGNGGTPGDLKDNAKTVTVGLNYTPIPLVTLKAERSVGDINATNVGLNFTWRPGIPWRQQTSAESVDMLRSLMGSMRELVDRNYDIVMQYRKQELLRISLPQQVNSRAAETLTLPLTIHKAKYGLKEVEWTAGIDFYTYGGSLRKISLTEVEIRLPAFAYNLPAAPTQQYVINAVGTDQYGNRSNIAATTIILAPSRNIVSALTVLPSGSVPANNSDYFTATAAVRDENNQPMVAQPITFTVDNLKGSDGYSAASLFVDGRTHSSTLTVNTDSAGNASVKIRSKLAKEGTLRAAMNNGNYKSAPLPFIADAATARIDTLDILVNRAIADGHSSNKLQVTVKDLNGNPVTGARVELSATNNAALVNGNAVTTSASGQADIQVTSALVGDSIVTARMNGTSKSRTVAFIADRTTAEIADGNLTATQNALANGRATNIVTATLTDAHGNPVAGANVTFTISPGATLTTLNGVTGSDGIAKASVTSLTAATFTVTARILESGNSARTTTRFIADASTATLIDSNLVINPNGALANGTATDGVEATVTDANGNLLSNAQVTFSVAAGATLRDTAIRTGSDGKAKTTLTSTTVGSYAVRATVNGRSITKAATFIADSGTARIASGDLTVTANNAKADGVAMNAVQATVKDARGNLVPNVTVAFAVTQGATLTAASAVTNAMGIARATVKNTRAGVTQVTASINDSSQRVDTLFMADSSTGRIASGDLTVITNGSAANGRQANEVRAKVTDAFGNTIANATVAFSATNGAIVTPASATTDTQGLANARLTNTTAGIAKVTARVNNNSQSVNTNFVADSTTATVSNLAVTVDNALANGIATNAVKAEVKDTSGNVVPGVTVTFSATNGGRLTLATVVTTAEGLAITTLANTAAGVTRVTATANGTSRNVNTNFLSDSSSATLTATGLTVTENNAKANGTAKNTVQAKVTDAFGNVVPGARVSFSANNGARVAYAEVTANAQGLASTNLTSTTAGVAKVTATVNGTSRNVDTTFIADTSTATIRSSDLSVVSDNAKADGLATNKVQAKVTDANGNLISGITVSFTANNNAQVTTASAVTNGQGIAATTLTNTRAGTTKVTATINGISRNVDTTFMADEGSATIVSGNLTVTGNNAKANGTATNTVQAKVTDNRGNLVPGVTVNFSANNGAQVLTVSVVTNDQGIASTMLTNTAAGTSVVTAAVNGNRQSVNTTFVADSTTARIINGNLTVIVNNAKANGTATNAVQAKVTDANGNLVPNVTVRFAADNGARLTAASATSNAQGIATTTLTNILAGVTKVTATLNGSSQTVDTTFVTDATTARIISGNLTVTVNNAIANGTATNTVQAKVTDANGNLVSDVTVNFTANNGAALVAASATTNAEGIATTTLKNTHAGVTKVTATLNSSSQIVDTTFVADAATARIVSGNLTVMVDNAIANGTATNSVLVKVIDANGNSVPNVTASFTADNGATLVAESATTNVWGLTYINPKNTRAGVTKVTATLNGSSQSVDTTFVADATTARIISSNMTVTEDNAKANGTATNTVQVKVTDANDNLIPDFMLYFGANNGATLVAASGSTNAQGILTITLTNTRAGVTKVTAARPGTSQTVNTTFVADEATARIISGNLTVTVNNAIANGTATNAVRVKVTDANDNLVPDVAVSFTADNGARLTTASSVTTNAQGIVNLPLSNTLAGVTNVTATVNGSSQSVGTMFIADVATATVTQVSLNGAVVEKTANGTDTFTFTALVKDANGNVVPGVTVNWSHDKGALAVLQTPASITDANGMTSTILTSTRNEALAIQVSATVATVRTTNADNKVSFKASLVHLQGQVSNGVNNNLLPGARIELFQAQGDTTPLYQGTTGSNGRYSIVDIPQGTYLMRTSLNGFISLDQTLDISNVTSREANVVLSPNLSGKAARIVLTWGTEPSDLDSYLWVPTTANPNAFVFVNYQHKTPAGADANLDVDDTSGEGPETITVTSVHPGVYCYVVHRYSPSPLSYGGARVQLYLSDGTSRTFRIEDAPQIADAYNWTVFKMDTTSGQFIVTPVNKLTSKTDSTGGACN